MWTCLGTVMLIEGSRTEECVLWVPGMDVWAVHVRL